MFVCLFYAADLFFYLLSHIRRHFFFLFLFKSVVVSKKLKKIQRNNHNLLNTVFRISLQIKMFAFLLGLFLKKQNEVDIWTPSPLVTQH